MVAPLAPLVEAAWKQYSRPDPDRPVPDRLAVPVPLRAFFLAGVASGVVASKSDRHIVAVVPSDAEADALIEDLSLFVDNAMLLPPWETLPFELVSPATATMGRRAEVRHRLGTEQPVVVVASVRALTQRPSPSPVAPISVTEGIEIDLPGLQRDLGGMGYERTHQVEVRGEFAVRGGVVDVFPAQADGPFRIELWGDEVESIRELSVASQRSGAGVDRLDVYPAREFRPDSLVMSEADRLAEAAPWARATW